jgi:hypothetical protein
MKESEDLKARLECLRLATVVCCRSESISPGYVETVASWFYGWVVNHKPRPDEAS